MVFCAIKAQEISTDWKCRLPLEKQFNIKLLSKKNWEKNFSYFRKCQNHLKNLLWFLHMHACIYIHIYIQALLDGSIVMLVRYVVCFNSPNWQNWLHFLILEGGPLVIFLVLYFSLTIPRRCKMSVIIASFLTQQGPGIHYLQNAFPWSMTQMASSLESIDTFYLWLASI